MSKSRLEKFLYALYSLDSSDLPTPLSRIEELYKCWVTGEKVPSFKPLSRVEKYLMAILGAYNVNELPNPLSRVEVLLYKLATGDDNLDDIETFLSEHEELLAEIIRNGGVGGNIDIEYVLYTLSTEFNTLYNTAEKPVKSAILKGNTERVFSPLKNLFDGFLEMGSIDDNNGVLISNTNYYRNVNFIVIEPSTNYIISTNGAVNGRLFYYDINFNFISTSLSANKALSPSNAKYMKFRIDKNKIDDKIQVEKNKVVTDYEDPNYILQSVKMPVLTTVGKNLFDKNKLEEGELSHVTGEPKTSSGRCRTSKFIQVKGGSLVTLSKSTNEWFRVFGYDNNKNFVSDIINRKSSSETFVIPSNICFIKIKFDYTLDIAMVDNIQLEIGDKATAYEPYKSNILTTPSDLELRGIGDVRDELNPFTGELTQRIGEFVFDGDERFKMSTSDNNAFFYHELGGDMLIPSFTKKMISNNLLDYADYATMKNTENSMYTNGKSIYIHLTNDINSVSLLQTYLTNNPIKIITCLSNESVKTVDLSVVDQDGNNAELSTFDDITHVTLSSEGLIPKAELEVATKNEEDLEDSVVYAVHTLSEEFNTLYNTAEKPVKSAILKGDTLVNLSPLNGEITLAPGSVQFIDIPSIKSNTIYTISFNCSSSPSTNFIEFRQAFDNTALKMDNIPVVQGYNRFKITTVNKKLNRVRFKNDTTSETDIIFNNLMILEGDYTNINTPYIEGMQSIKMPVLKTTGKNLFDNKFKTSSYASGKAYFPNGTMTSVAFPHTTTNISRGIASIIKVKPDTSYTVTISNRPEKSVILGSGYENIDDMSTASNAVLTVGSVGNDTITTRSFTTTSDCNYMVIGCYAKYEQNTTNIITFNEAPHIQLEEGSEATEYEHHESTTVTCEGVELRGIGDVKDELDLVTGELTRRIDESGNILSQEITESIDLSVVDQDGNSTKLSTFNDITHVTLSSEGLTPEAELEVAEKVTEVAASMLSISREQEVIDATTNEQSENVDATMIATTEIYEGLL